MNIITISREFGSGGREIGKRLADTLGYTYYDKTILNAISERISGGKNDVEGTLNTGFFANMHLTNSRTLAYIPPMDFSNSYQLAHYHRMMKDVASIGDCVIVGSGADVTLREFSPFSVFVYAEMPAKIARCKSRAMEEESNLSDKEWEKKIRQVDKNRASRYTMIAASSWGDMHNYDICVDTTYLEIKNIVPLLAQYAKIWFENR